MYDKDYLDWERKAYERNKTRHEQRLRRRVRTAFWVAVAVWAVVLILVLTIPVSSQAPAEQFVEPAAETPQDDGRLPGDDIPASGYASIEAMPLQYLGEFKITYYCACERCCGRWSDGITSTGTTATQGRTIAVDPSVIPYGTEVEIVYQDGSAERFLAEDCGSAIVNRRIDIFRNSHDEALEFGVTSASVYVVEVDE